jgi:glutathione S-transferase
VFEHRDFRLYETQAILRYLDDVFPEPPLEPDDPRAAPRINQIIRINDFLKYRRVQQHQDGVICADLALEQGVQQISRYRGA